MNTYVTIWEDFSTLPKTIILETFDWLNYLISQSEVSHRIIMQKKFAKMAKIQSQELFENTIIFSSEDKKLIKLYIVSCLEVLYM